MKKTLFTLVTLTLSLSFNSLLKATKPEKQAETAKVIEINKTESIDAELVKVVEQYNKAKDIYTTQMLWYSDEDLDSDMSSYRDFYEEAMSDFHENKEEILKHYILKNIYLVAKES